MKILGLFSLVICALVVSVVLAAESPPTPLINPLEVKVASVLSDSIEEQLKPGEALNRSIILVNPTASPITARITALGDPGQFIRFEGKADRQISLKIESNATAVLRLSIATTSATSERTYLGDILISSAVNATETIHRIPVTLVIKSKREQGLLDVKVNVLSGFIKEGQPVRFIVGLVNLGTKQRFDLNLSYTVKDENDNIVARKPDTRAIETTLSFVEKMDIPKNAKPGGYIIQADASYNGFTASAIDTFALQSGVPLGEFVFADWMFWLFLPLLVLFILSILYLWRVALRPRSQKPLSEKDRYALKGILVELRLAAEAGDDKKVAELVKKAEKFLSEES